MSSQTKNFDYLMKKWSANESQKLLTNCKSIHWMSWYTKEIIRRVKEFEFKFQWIRENVQRIDCVKSTTKKWFQKLTLKLSIEVRIIRKKKRIVDRNQSSVFVFGKNLFKSKALSVFFSFFLKFIKFCFYTASF